MVSGDLGGFGLNVQPLVAVVSNGDQGCADNHHSVVMSVWEMVIKLKNAVFNLAKVCCLIFLYLFNRLNNKMLITCATEMLMVIMSLFQLDTHREHLRMS